MAGDTKNVLLRLDPDVAEQLSAIAEVEGRAVSAVMRDALAEHIDRRRRDPAFRRLMRQSLKRHARLLAALEDDER